ncbi:methyl-accepting chemotaxis protein [Paenibacillus lemnae]|uniref:Methyl-accepting chemotaxis protein n=1 Tax=Paenibacillus lemnae TaxID=1330551 RepID=A0A848MCQ6_PAELE|nr:HAMP domain-containing methyl-accepting chemotaxis protein [Paenibacillus lemnae]NMO97853.1 methyl-accepting chemotaxis protein [Paenibacillus lemnae]
MAVVLFIVMFFFGYRQWQQMESDVEEQLLEKGSALVISLSKSLQAITEDDIRQGVTLSSGEQITGAELKERLFNDQLTVIPESEESARKRLEANPEAMEKPQKLFNGDEIPLWQYELKYSSAYDLYTDDKWQSVIDSFLVDSSVVFAIPAAYSENPLFAGYIATHNTTYSPTDEGSKDDWGDTGLLSQKYRANRVFNDLTGYQAAAYQDTSKVNLQKYPRVIGGVTVETWDISYPLMIDGQHWGGVRVALSKEKSDQIVAVQKQTVLIQYCVLFVTVLLAIYILNRLIVGSKLRQVLKAARNLNSGQADMTSRIPVKGKDELAELSGEVNFFIEKLENLLGKVRNYSGKLTLSSDQLASSAEYTRSITSQMTQSLDHTVQGTEVQSQAIRESSAAMDELAGGVRRVAEFAGSVSHSSSVMNQGAEHGHQSMKRTVEQMNMVTQATDAVEQAIHQLSRHSERIGEIAASVTAMSSQTHLLALNAAIEAAQAGEHGRGFSVIASEIRKLSEESRASSEQISDLIMRIQESNNNAVRSIQEGSHEVSRGIERMTETNTIFEELLASARSIDNQMSEISLAAEQMSAGTQEISASLEEVSQIAQGSAASSAEMAQGASRQAEAIEQTADLAVRLKHIANELERNTSQFILKQDK